MSARRSYRMARRRKRFSHASVRSTTQRNLPRPLPWAVFRRAITGWIYLTPANMGIETFYFDKPHGSRGALAQIKREMTTLTPESGVVRVPLRGRIGTLLRIPNG